MFLVIIQPYDLVLETGVRLVEVRQADEYWCAVATGTDVHQTNGSASSVAVAVANVHHVRILFRDLRHFRRVFSLEEVLGGGGLLEVFRLLVRITSPRVVPQSLLAQNVLVTLHPQIVNGLGVLVYQRPARRGGNAMKSLIVDCIVLNGHYAIISVAVRQKVNVDRLIGSTYGRAGKQTGLPEDPIYVSRRLMGEHGN